jgi:basic amino acid/polyamine antiporter, APA family
VRHETWITFIVWGTLGIIVYFLYSKRHSKLQNGEYGETFKAEREPLERPDL